MIRTAIISLAALFAALGSTIVQQHGPDYALTCGVGVIGGVEVTCPKPVLSAGWPAPWLYDSWDTSVTNQIGVEDDTRFGPLAATYAFWWLVAALLARLVRPRRR